ncbi:MAG: UDP-N-acetylmuramate--L-alanine ligase [Clostridia bacterium]|nr:UDP-N-acetylmuramate--L-alanine ligase [Clostridia bacterium]
MMNVRDFFDFLKGKPKLFFLGIGGVSMSSLAFWAKRQGCDVAGFDATLSPVTEKLEKSGIPVTDSFSEENYRGVDLIVYTGAIHDTDPVLSYPRSQKIPEMTRAEFLGLMMKSAKNPIGVAGTHGKSTTTGMLSSIFLADESRDPTIMVGAVMPALDSTYRIGGGDDFLFEACEYQNSFLSFFPHLALILNVEHDHADFFPTLEDMLRSFIAFADIAKDGKVIINGDNPGAMRVCEKTKSPVFIFSKKEKKDIWCENLKEEKGFFSFDIMTQEGLYTPCTLSVPGEHNVENALAAAAAAYLSGIEGEVVRRGLLAFRGVKRRFEYRGTCGEMPVFDDYAHHPDEIRATLKAVKKLGYESITVVFQSHTFTRTRAYWDEFLSSLSLADRVIFADIYPARELPLEGIDAPHLAAASKNGEYLGDFDAIAKNLLEGGGKGILLIMGAGDIIQLTDRILTRSNF